MNVHDLFGLSGKRALITGSSKGIGHALARGLAGAGAEIVINGRDGGKLQEAADQLQQDGAVVSTAVFDVTEPDEVKAGVAKIEADIGQIDILVNNAGMQHRTPLEDFADEDWDRLMRTNLYSVFNVGNSVIPNALRSIICIAINTASPI